MCNCHRNTQQANIAVAESGSNRLIEGRSGFRIRVWGIWFLADISDVQTISFRAGTEIIGAEISNFGLMAPFVLPIGAAPWMVLPEGVDLNLYTNAPYRLGGQVVYDLEAA